jgi:hypothetical protein
MAMKADHQWVTASPLWSVGSQVPALMQRPALLRFASDNFMEELAELLRSNPEKLVDHIAKPESFRARPTGKPLTWTPPLPDHLKLYQPAHGHFYLVATSLVCRLPALPDRRVNVAKGEKVSFVVRRIEAGAKASEMAWVPDPKSSKNKTWLPLTADNSGQYTAIANSEELFPMFPTTFEVDGMSRRIFVGLVPTSSRESFQAAPKLSPAPQFDVDTKTNQPKDPRLEEAEVRILSRIDAFAALSTATAAKSVTEPENEANLFLLLDFADYLMTHAPSALNAIVTGSVPGSGDAAHDLYSTLDSASVAGAGTASWQQAVVSVWQQRDLITGETAGQTSLQFDLKKMRLDPNRIDTTALRAGLKKALGSFSPETVSLPVVMVPKLGPNPETRYVIRCVYQRPHCGALAEDIVSNPTEQFALAPFFDFDAPARPIRIALPADTSIAGLRKFPKNVAVLMSDKLRQQMASLKDAKKALDGEISDTGETFVLGEICSFSIPIITLCAFIVLFIFLMLLNIVFWWLPFLRICLPIPMKAKN